MNNHCIGTEFDRLGKRWAWCCWDGKIYELTAAQTHCMLCRRPWSPTPATPREMHRIRADVEQYVDFPHYKARAAVADDLEQKLKTLRAAGDWALRGLEKLAREEAVREATTFELCDYTFAKGLRNALIETLPTPGVSSGPQDTRTVQAPRRSPFPIPADVLRILWAFKSGTPPSHKFCECRKCVALYEACRAYPVYEMPPAQGEVH